VSRGRVMVVCGSSDRPFLGHHYSPRVSDFR
jgi:hypothetical protein